MLEKLSNSKDTESKLKDFEARQNLLGFFNLLFEIDKRNNPQNYKKPQINENNGNTNSANKTETRTCGIC